PNVVSPGTWPRPDPRAVTVAEGVLGLLRLFIVLLDVFLPVVVPRRGAGAGRIVRVSSHLVPGLWQVWRWVGLRQSSAERREAFLGSYGALVVILLLVAWIAGLVIAYGLMLDALRTQVRPEPENLGSSLYFAGTALLTLGFA